MSRDERTTTVDRLDQGRSTKRAYANEDAALLIWLLSYALPSFIAERAPHPLKALEVLLAGLMFGWAVWGWAVYANVFFVYAYARLKSGKRPFVALTIMLLLAATLPWYQGMPQGGGDGRAEPVASWGWGAGRWLLSLALLALTPLLQASFMTPRLTRWVAAMLGVVVAGISLGIGRLHVVQLERANTQERATATRSIAPSMSARARLSRDGSSIFRLSITSG